MNLDIPQGEYTTLSGYIISGLRIYLKQVLIWDLDHFHVKIVKATDKRIELVNLKVRPRE